MTDGEIAEWCLAAAGRKVRPFGRLTRAMIQKLGFVAFLPGRPQMFDRRFMVYTLREALTLRNFKPWEKKVIRQMLAEVEL